MDLDDLLKQIKKSPEPAVKEPTPTKPSKPAPAKPQPIEDVTKISPQMQKRINDFFKSDHQVEEAPVKVKAMFDKKAFVFIPFGTILDKKKVDAITERIRRRGGMTFRVDFFDWKKPSFVELFIIVSKDMPYQEFMNSIPETIRGMLDRFVFVDWKWISDCLQQNDLLDSKPYQVNWKKIAEAEEIAKREQIKKEEEARKRELEAQLIVELEPEPIQHQQFEEEGLRKSPGREEKREEIEVLKKEEVLPKRKMRVRENEVIMNAYRHLYDYRFGIEDEGEGEMEVENNEGGTLVHQETEKIVYDDEDDQEEEFKNLMKQVATQPQEEEKEPSETAMELEDELPPKKESKANVFDLMMKAQRSPQRSPNSSRGLLLGERSPTSLDHHSQGKKDLVADPAPQANLNKHLTDEFERLLQAYVNDRDKGRM